MQVDGAGGSEGEGWRRRAAKVEDCVKDGGTVGVKEGCQGEAARAGTDDRYSRGGGRHCPPVCKVTVDGEKA